MSMKRMTALQDVEDLLGEIKERIVSDGLLYMNKLAKNAQTLADLGITSQRQREIIDSIVPEDYCGGPDPDEKYPWKFVAVFGKDIGGTELYIKFSVGMTGTPVVCLSFHEADYPMPYQFK
jgi:hypothetical protein